MKLYIYLLTCRAQSKRLQIQARGCKLINIDDLTIGQLKQIQSLSFCGEKTKIDIDPLVGKNVIIRTVSMIYTGLLVGVNDKEFILEKCSWIPETDRYAQFVADGKVKQCEPFPELLRVYVNRDALMERCELKSELPRSQK